MQRSLALKRTVFLVFALLALIVASPFPARTAFAGPSVGGCPVLRPDDVWNTPIDTLPVHANSSAYVTTIGAGLGLKADFGAGLWAGGPIGIPFVTVPGTQPKYNVDFTWDDESDPGPYAVPLNAPIEGGPNATGDRHAISLDTTNCILYELYAAYPGTNSWEADSGAIYDLQSYDLRPETWTSADAAGLPIFPGLVRYDEIAAGEITHAIRFTVPQTQRAYVWPARHYASSLTGAQYPPMGMRFRLRADFDITGFSATNQIILRALKKYGMILADNGSAWYMSGAPDSRWNNSDLNLLRNVLGSSFDAVDVSSLMIDEDSSQARQPVPDVYAVTWGAHSTPASMQTGLTQTINVSLTNKSNFTWVNSGPNPVNVTYHWRNGACNGTSDAVWQGIRTALPSPVAPNGTVSNLGVKVQAPTTAGTYCLQYDLSREGVAWFSKKKAPMLSRTVTVTAPTYGVLWGSSNAPGSMRRNTNNTVVVSFTNTGSATWTNSGANPVNFAYHWRTGACNGTASAVWQGLRTPLLSNVAPGGTMSNLNATIRTPATAGTYCLQFDMVRGSGAWFSASGQPMLSRTVTITN